MGEKKTVKDQSGWCRHSGHHHFCWGEWDTPSVHVVCDCACHVVAEVQADLAERKIVAKAL